MGSPTEQLENNNLAYDDWIKRRKAYVREKGEPALSRTDRETLASLKGKYKGNRIFLVGNGPSLNKMNIDLLKNEYTFGVNRIYLMFDKTDWRPTFYTSIDWRVTPDIRDEIAEIDDVPFMMLPSRYKGFLSTKTNPIWYRLAGGGPFFENHFSPDVLEHGVAGRGSVLVQVIQLAFYMGFSPIYLIGVDVNYTVLPTVDQTGGDRFGTGTQLLLTSTEDDDPNHFDPRYFGAGRKWHDPNTNEMIRAFIACRKAVEYYGGEICNATVGGNLNQIPRVNYNDLF